MEVLEEADMRPLFRVGVSLAIFSESAHPEGGLARIPDTEALGLEENWVDRIVEYSVRVGFDPEHLVVLGDSQVELPAIWANESDRGDNQSLSG